MGLAFGVYHIDMVPGFRTKGWFSWAKVTWGIAILGDIWNGFPANFSFMACRVVALPIPIYCQIQTTDMLIR